MQQVHPYSVGEPNNADERAQVVYKLAGLAGIGGTALGIAAGYLAQHWGWATAAGAPSSFAIFALLTGLVNNYAWRWSIVRSLLGISTPDLNGRWPATVYLTERDGTRKQNETGIFTVQQTYRYMGIGFETDRTTSHSTAGSILIGANGATVLYHYHTTKRRPDRDAWPDEDGAGALQVDLPHDGRPVSCRQNTYFTNERAVGTLVFEGTVDGAHSARNAKTAGPGAASDRARDVGASRAADTSAP